MSRANHEGSIYQRKDGRWVASVTLPDGRRKDRYARTRAEAAKQLTTLLKTVQEGLPVVSERQTVAAFLERWLTDSARPSVRPATYQSYARLVRGHLIPGLGHHRLARLEPAHVQRFLNAKAETGLSPRTVAYLRAVLRRALGQALKWGEVSRNVAALTDPPKQRRPEITPWSAEQTARFLQAVAGDRLAALYTVAALLGLRQSEALGLRWCDVDFEAGSLAVRQTLSRVTRRADDPKTASARRTLPLLPAVAAALRQQRAAQLAERLQAGPLWRPGPGLGDLVFTTATGAPLSGTGVYRQFARRVEVAGLPRIRFHDLRHGAATLLLSQGVPAKIVAEILGHSSIQVTLDIYSHVAPALLSDALGRVEQAVWRPVTGAGEGS